MNEDMSRVPTRKNSKAEKVRVTRVVICRGKDRQSALSLPVGDEVSVLVKPTRRETVPANTNQAPPPSLVMSRSEGPQPGVDRSWRYPDVHGREGVSMRENRPEGTGGYLQPPIPPFAGRGPPNLGGTTPESPPANLSCRLCGRMSSRGEFVRLGGFCSEEDKWQWERNHGWG